MNGLILAHEATLRLAAFLGVLSLLLLLETLAPRRGGERLRRMRWSANLPLVIVDTLLVRLLLPLGAVGTALWAQDHGVGLFNRFTLPFAAVASFLALDALIYAQHRLFHRVPLFWRLHRVHHSDVEFDATTALRFHPLEIAVSMLVKMAAVLALGAPAAAVVVFEVALNASAMFSHSNLALPPALDRILRAVIVTPDMHRVHHSVDRREHDRNYGFNLSLWDRLFGSYTAQPAAGHVAMQIGLPEFREEREQRLLPLLRQPMK